MLKIKSDVYLSQKSGILQQKKVGALWRKENVQCFFNNFSNVTQCLQMSRFHVQSRRWEFMNVSVVALVSGGGGRASWLLLYKVLCITFLRQKKKKVKLVYFFIPDGFLGFSGPRCYVMYFSF